MERKKILITGPIGDKGGREVEAGFFAATLQKNGFNVNVLSTGYISVKSQLLFFIEPEKVDSVNKILFEKIFLYKVLSIFSWLKNFGKLSPHGFVSNLVTKRFLNYKKQVNSLLDHEIQNYDVIIFLGQITSNYSKEIIESTNKHRKKIIYRTTGMINIHLNVPKYFEKVNLFVHHSVKNHTYNLQMRNPNFEILDQTAVNESSFLNIPVINKISTFIMLGKISKHKGMVNVLNFFSKIGIKDDLIIIGEGDLKTELEQKFNLYKNIHFAGFVEHNEIHKYFKKADCIIIASDSEAGPLVGIEAMAAGRIILSCKVGAMEERLEGTLNDFWFENDDSESFKSQFNRIKELTEEQVSSIGNINRKKYLKNYSNVALSEKLVKTLNKQIF